MARMSCGSNAASEVGKWYREAFRVSASNQHSHSKKTQVSRHRHSMPAEPYILRLEFACAVSSAASDLDPSDGGHVARRLQPRRPAAVRWSALARPHLVTRHSKVE